MKILRIDVENRRCIPERTPDSYLLLGGRSFTSTWIAEHLDPECEPLGRRNHLVIAPGLLAGTPASSVHRLSVGAKSPLTGGIKESNSGGNVAYKLARLGIKAVVIEGIPSNASLEVIRLHAQGAEFESAEDLVGKGTAESAEGIHARFGREVGFMVIGPAGEHRLSAAAIVNSDREGYPARVCGRGGLGAVMATKGIKAIVIDDAGTKPVTLDDKSRFRAAVRKYTRLIKETPQTSETYTKYGTAAMTDVTNELGGLPTMNFRFGRFAGADKITGHTLYQTIVDRGGDPSHACMPGCMICSSNIYVDSSGRTIVRSLEYETLVMLGPNCGIDDLDELALINKICNDVGLDSIEMGGAMGLAMEAGVIPFGDTIGIKSLLEEVRQGTVVGRVLGSGGAITGKVLGVKRIPAVKGQTMAAYDPRAIKGHGVTFATSPMGADHTAGFTIREGMASHDKKGQIEASARMQVNGMIYDSLGVCLFVHVAIRSQHHLLTEMVNGRWGTALNEQELRETAIRTLEAEKAFNRNAGLGPATDRLPETFREEVNPSSGTLFDIPAEELDEIEYK
jgi:aldehyde:ferredoxin oxidoreductase